MMGTTKGAEQIILIGRPVLMRSKSPTSEYAVAFEDNGESGDFYALDLTNEDDPLLDSLNIYFVAEIANREAPCDASIIWSADGMKAVFGINFYPHAVFDFERRRGYCRTNYPPPNPYWTRFGHDWNDAALELFRPHKKK